MRLAHDDFRRAHFDHWRADNDFVSSMFVTRVPVSAALGNKAAGGGEESGYADK